VTEEVDDLLQLRLRLLDAGDVAHETEELALASSLAGFTRGMYWSVRQSR
jgi:hypothetical protein